MRCGARVFGRAGFALVLMNLISCSPSASIGIHDGSAEDIELAPASVAQSPSSARCVVSQNLLADAGFSDISGGVWAYTQHAGDRSFSVMSEQGQLTIIRTGVEPWMLLKQKIARPAINPDLIGKWIFSAELKGQVETEPVLHGFEHVAGLFLQPAMSPMSAKVAEHDPNQGVWDWQRVEVSAPVLSSSGVVQAGFVHQAGGSLWARNPSLVLMECEEPN